MSVIAAMGGLLAGNTAAGFPVYKETTASSFATAANNHAVAMSATVNAGDLLICFFANANSGLPTPSGWTLLGTRLNGLNDSDGLRTSAFYRVADGSEAGGTVNFATTSSVPAAAQVVRVGAGTWSGTPAQANVTDNSSPQFLPSLTPSWWAADTLWIGFMGWRAAERTVTAWPFADGQLATIGGGAGLTTSAAASAYKEMNAAELPSNTYSFSLSSNSPSNQASVFTIAVRPA